MMRNPAGPGVPSVVFVHGAWADGSSWMEVIARLQAAGLRAVSVQAPLTSLADDVAAVTRALEREPRPVVLVGHAWGGTVITMAGMSHHVGALVYIAAFAPDAGQTTNEERGAMAGSAPGHALETDSGGFLWFSQELLPRWFAQDLPSPNARLLAATQRPIRAGAFDERISVAAWHLKPAWYLVAENDRMFAPDLQRRTAMRIGARMRTVDASHVPFLSRPRETTEIVLEAVASLRAS